MVHRVQPAFEDKIFFHDINITTPEAMARASKFRVNAIPHSFLFDAQGKLINHTIGAAVDEMLIDRFTEAGFPPDKSKLKPISPIANPKERAPKSAGSSSHGTVSGSAPLGQ